MGVYRGRPPLNKQNLDNSCWAACFDVFSRVTANVPTYKESSLITSYGIGDKGGLNLANLRKLRDEKLTPNGAKLEEAIANEDMSPQYIQERLESSHVILMYQTVPNSTDWHAVLVYGMDNWLIYMDPREGTYKKIPLYTMISLAGFYVIWRPRT